MKNGKIDPPDFSTAIQCKISALKRQYYFFWVIFISLVSIFIISRDIGIQWTSLSITAILLVSLCILDRHFKENNADLVIYYKQYFEDRWTIDVIEMHVQKYWYYLDELEKKKAHK